MKTGPRRGLQYFRNRNSQLQARAGRHADFDELRQDTAHMASKFYCQAAEAISDSDTALCTWQDNRTGSSLGR